MSKKYILNKTNSVLLLQDAKVNTIVKLNPKKCSFQSFEEDYLFSSPYVQRMFSKGMIELLDEKVEVITKSNAKDYGQKYKIGTRAYLNDKNNLDIEILAFNPHTNIYTVKLLRTGGKMTTQESSITLRKNKGDNINVDIDENGELADSTSQESTRDLSLPQEPEQVQVVHTQDQTVNKAKNAKQLIDNKDAIAEEIANQKVDVVFADEKEQSRPEDEEETFIVKAKDGKFAKEVTSSEMIKNTQEAIQDSLQEVIDSTVVAKPEEKQEFDSDAFNKLDSSMQKYIMDFMDKDARQKKMVISRLKDIQKLSAIASCADELSVKAAKAKIEKLLG